MLRHVIPAEPGGFGGFDERESGFVQLAGGARAAIYPVEQAEFDVAHVNDLRFQENITRAAQTATGALAGASRSGSRAMAALPKLSTAVHLRYAPVTYPPEASA